MDIQNIMNTLGIPKNIPEAEKEKYVDMVMGAAAVMVMGTPQEKIDYALEIDAMADEYKNKGTDADIELANVMRDYANSLWRYIGAVYACAHGYEMTEDGKLKKKSKKKK